MAIDVECTKCSHAWTVPTAKAGRSIYCPECDESVSVPRPKAEVPESEKPERVRPGHRPKTDRRSKDRTLLIGAVVLLLGVLVVVGLRIKSVMSDPNLEFDASPVTDLAGRLSASPTTDAGGESSDETDAATEPPASESGAEDSAAETTNDAAESTAEVPTTDAVSDDARRRQLAGLQTVAVELNNFAPDVRGAVSNVVDTAVVGAMQRCKLKYDDAADTVMQINLELKNSEGADELWMTAELIAPLGETPAKLWERSGGLGTISAQAFSSGILPPGLERGVSTFFNDLRGEFVSARREFQK